MQLMRNAGISVPEHSLVRSISEVEEAVRRIGGSDFILKAQVATGGRRLGQFENGLKGGIQSVTSAVEARDIASKMLGQKLVTRQTGSAGIVCNELLLCKRLYLRREAYFSITLDRAFGGPVMIACKNGGVDIETVAAEDPQSIVKIPVNIKEGVSNELALEVARAMGFNENSIGQAADIVVKLYNLFIKSDCTLLEINPMAEDSNSHVYCVDCKMILDDSASFRQRELFKLASTIGISDKERRAVENHLNFIPLKGNIGCLVNGAGLAMATMDIIKLHGGEPADFLDVGGGATIENVTEAFRIITDDPNVRAVLVNIFGGILRCDVIAAGIVQAAKELKLKVPVVCRLQGTNVDDAKALIANNNLKLLAVDNLDEAARMVSAVKVLSSSFWARYV
ncbi:unnamed protein product [Soboliphyme baturini]|uniref:Succinate-CoA ligase subunit beta n=1 Tax=Soboliphyme baturini TaxID=241478 RepID=A0A183IZ84_9BILA|nr:unnamed protein product [Soboliphyme baturini]